MYAPMVLINAYLIVMLKSNFGENKVMAKNGLLNKAKSSKNDEFYTQLTDIEKELRHYKEYFREKIIYCNCDDPRVSNFFKYFYLNFEHFGLKRLITTCYKNQEIDLFSQNNSEKAVWIEYEGGGDIQRFDNIKVKELKGDGDFRSEECIEILKTCDIVVTNPPFSLFREYVSQLMKYEKKFIIIGHQNAITYKDIFQHILNNKLWLGCSIHSGDREFQVPSKYVLHSPSKRIDEKGNQFVRVSGVRWFSNLDYKERHENILLWKKYSPEEYPFYDDYNAINVNKTADIPLDYFESMGVPITFLDKYNPDQFEIIGLDRYVEDNPRHGRRFTINGKETYARIIIMRKR